MAHSDKRASAHNGNPSPERKRRAAVATVLLGLTVLTGCTHVISHTTPYYKDGPSQLDPPQGNLEAGTYVWVVGKEGTYSHVWGGGVNAYVLEGDVQSVWQWWGSKRQEEQRQQ